MALWLASAKATTTTMDTVCQGEGHSSHPSEHQPLFWALNLKNKMQTLGKKKITEEATITGKTQKATLQFWRVICYFSVLPFFCMLF